MNLFQPRQLGNTDVQLNPLGLGGAPIGELYEKLPEAVVSDAIETAYRLGIRYFDTAPWYGHGLSEHRFGHVLRQKRRDEFILSTKVGRVYSAPKNLHHCSTSPWIGGLPFELRFDYRYDGIMRSYEDSLQRLSLNRVDLLLIHDLDTQYHQDLDGVEQCFKQLDGGRGWTALEELKATGLIKGIGAGINSAEMIHHFLDRFPIDFFLVAMPYTLLDQSPLNDEFSRCAEHNIGIVIGAPYASGILATGPITGAKYAYEPASNGILQRVQRISAICERHGVGLQAAALQFPLGHPNVAAVIPGAVSASQVAANVDLVQHAIPKAFWQELKSEQLIVPDAPIPI